MKQVLVCFLFMQLCLVTGCKKLIEVPDPDTEVVRAKVFEEEGTALAAVSGLYNKLVNSSTFGGGYNSLNITMGVYADELVAYQGLANLLPYYNNSIVATDPSLSAAWNTGYNIIYTANAAIEGLNGSHLSASVKKQLTGEALFVRSFIYLYLVSQFGDVPYTASTDYITNSKLTRKPIEDIYPLIIATLEHAAALLSNEYPTGERVRINKAAATALLARVYLYHHEWEKAAAAATELINNSNQYKLIANLDSVFLKNSSEAIWQLMPFNNATNEAQAFVLVSQPTRIALSERFVSNVFESNDQRKQKWVGSVSQGFSTWYFPHKYKVRLSNGVKAEYSMTLRLAEQYLIRAEAAAQQDKLTEALNDVNIIRKRAGLNDTPAASKEQVLQMIEKERRAELFTEWGHRFFDLKRWGKLDSELPGVKNGWNSTDALLPIPQSALLTNNLLTQNPGF